MELDDIIEHFGDITRTAEALGVSRQTIHNWKRQGDIPTSRRFHAEAIIRINQEAGIDADQLQE